MPVMSADCTEPRLDHPGEVEGLRLERVHPAGLVRGVHRAGEQAGRDEHEDAHR